MTTPARFRRQQWMAYDRRCAAALNRAATFRTFERVCCWASRLGDGVLWYVLIALLPLFDGAEGRECALQMIAAGTVSLTVYWLLKQGVARRRPYVVCPEIRLGGGRVLDEFSFPSGHMLHAAGFSCILVYHYPTLTFALIPIIVLIALSRVVLGLHYPSDVLGGAIIGAVSGLAAIWAL